MPDGAPTTPLMEQYEAVRAQYPGHLVLFRVGDFYETFGDDARLMSRELEVVLTARSPDSAGTRVPMAGVPHHALETYLGRLVRKGFRVAICDQVEDPRLAKGLVRREVTRVVTPGTVVEDRILPGAEHNFLVTVAVRPGAPAEFAAVDITTGEWFRGRATESGPDATVAALAAFSPSEVLVTGAAPETLAGPLRREFPRARIDLAPAPGAEVPGFLAGLPEGPTDADRRLAAYVASTQPRLLPYLEVILDRPGARRLLLDAKTLRHLEITRPMNPDDVAGATLLSSWDLTVTSPGRRTLAFWLRQPLADLPSIHARLDAVEALRARGSELLAVRAALRPVADLARIASRVAGRRVRPPELGAIRESLAAVDDARRRVESGPRSALLEALHPRLDPLPELRELLARALPDEPPPRSSTGGCSAPGTRPTSTRSPASSGRGSPSSKPWNGVSRRPLGSGA